MRTYVLYDSIHHKVKQFANMTPEQAEELNQWYPFKWLLADDQVC